MKLYTKHIPFGSRIIDGIKYFLACILLFTYSENASAQPEAYTWGNVAIGGGGFVSGIITSKTEQDLIYIRTDVGGAYRWDADDSRWIPLLDWVSEADRGFLGVESIAIDPVAPNKVYMLVGISYFSNGKTAILRSSDYGNTFTVSDVTSQFKAHGNGMGRQTGEKLVVDPNKPDLLYCGTRANGLFKSLNSGSTWTRVSALNVTTTPNENGISFVVIDPTSGSSGVASSTIFVGVSRAGSDNLFKSMDGGTTFSAVVGAPTNFMPHRATLAADGNLYLTYSNGAGPHPHWAVPEPMDNGAVWKYNTTTGAWTNVTPTGFSRAFGGVSIDPANQQRLVLSTINTYMQQGNSWGDRIFISEDGGTSWIDIVARGFDLDPNGNNWVEGHAIHWAGSIEFDPFDTQKVWVTSGNGVFRTDNISATTTSWKFSSDGLEETVPLEVVSIGNGPLVSAIGDYDGFTHTDVTQYAPIHRPQMGTTTSIAVASLDPRIMLRVGDTLLHTIDAGATWTEISAKGKKGSVAISADGSVYLHCAENATTTYRSTDKGLSWSTVSGVTVVGAKPVADPVNPAVFYVYNPANGFILVSTDRGASFSAVGTAGASGSKIIRLAPNRQGDIWVPLLGGGLTRSVDSGKTFTKLPGVTYCGAVGFGKAISAVDYPAIYIWGRVGGILGVHRSVDEGATWTRVNDDDHQYGGPGNGQFVIGDMNVFGRVYMSTAGRGIVYGESDAACIPSFIKPYVSVDESEAEEVQYATGDIGYSVSLQPESTSNGTWSWTGPNGFMSSSREISISNVQVENSGLYTVQFTNEDGCTSAPQSYYIGLQVHEPVTSTERNTGSKYVLFPNPVSSHFTINSSNNLTSIKIVNLFGETVKTVEGNKEQTTISMEDLPAGCYVIELNDANKIKYAHRIIKY